MKQEYQVSFRCFFGQERGNQTNHIQNMPLKDIPKWLEAYMFTHPNVRSISVKIWPGDKEEQK